MKLAEKLAAIQQQIKVPKRRRNKFGEFNFRNAEDIMKAFKKYEKEYSVLLKLNSEVLSIGTSNYICGIAQLADLESDETIEAKAYAKEPPAAKAKMDESQTSGSATSYAIKYAMNLLLLLDDAIDFDSNEAIDTGEPASDAQIKTIEEIAGKHDVNLTELYKRQKVKKTPTAAQAGMILNLFKKNFGDD